MDNTQEAFVALVRLGIGRTAQAAFPGVEDWAGMKTLATRQGLSGVVLDAIDKIPLEQRPEKEVRRPWMGSVLKGEKRTEAYDHVVGKMARLFEKNHIRTYVLKGSVVAECYPNPNHRTSADFDCFLLPAEGDFDAWEKGNRLMEEAGFKVDRSYYKNSTIVIPGLLVENHRYLTPFRGNRTLMEFERAMQRKLKEDAGEDVIEGTSLNRPPVMVTALFLIEHAYSHFLHEGLFWRHILDWTMFSVKHRDDIDWKELDAIVDQYGFRRFYDSFNRLGLFLIGEKEEKDLTELDRRMLADVWANLDLHDTLKGVKGKLGLVGNTWRARWKYRLFSPISMTEALWIQVKGFLFSPHPDL